MPPYLLSALLCATALAQPQPGRLVEGKADSRVRVVIYEDLQCPDCAAFRQMLDEKLLPKYGAKVAFEHYDFPLAKHAWARPASIASRYFQTLGTEKASLWRSETMASLREIKSIGFPAWLEKFCQKHNLDLAKAKAALDDPALAALVEADFQDGVARGIARTPTALVNGEPFIETFTFEQISQGIDNALKEYGIE